MDLAPWFHKAMLLVFCQRPDDALACLAEAHRLGHPSAAVMIEAVQSQNPDRPARRRRTMSECPTRPFELLKLIRDGVVTHASDLRTADPRNAHLVDATIDNLVRTGLVARGLAQGEADIPFDIRHIRVLIYAPTPAGMAHLEDRLRAAIRHETKAR
jgi:hypothetical protein